MLLDHPALAVWLPMGCRRLQAGEMELRKCLAITSDCLAIPTMLNITLKNQRGEARSEVAEIWGEDAF